MMKRIAAIAFSCAMVLPAYASVQLESLFQNSREMYSESPKTAAYRLLLSAPKKVNSRWQFDREERLSAQIRRKTLELDERYTLDSALQLLESTHATQGARMVFMCDGLDCGSSNVWANEVFKIKQLYGLDSYQAYRVWDLNQEKGTGFTVAYLSQRGNGRLYLQVDLVKLSAEDRLHLHGSPRTMLASLESGGYYVLENEQAELNAMAQALRMKPMLKVLVVGHAYGRAEVTALVAQSQQKAAAVVEQLVAAGARSNQLRAEGVGPLAPRTRPGKNRIEIVLQ